MRKLILFIVILTVLGVGVFFVFRKSYKSNIVTPVVKKPQIFEKPLDKYTFDRLRDENLPGGSISIGDKVADGEGFASYMFYFHDGKKKVSGLMNLPTNSEGPYPIIVMNRGYVDKEQYTSGVGTKRTGEEFAKNGFITLAPDFLGYGESDMPSKKPMEERFQTYTTDLSLLASLSTLNKALQEGAFVQTADITKIGLWGHSNGGHITLSILEITGKPYPTVLWAPVSKMFPYSILYYTDEFEDHGKALRKVLADFEKDYDVEKYSPTNYFKWITAPISLHQGIADEEVPVRWSNELEKTLADDGIDVAYYTYPGENHNFNNGSWPLAVSRSVAFYREQFTASGSASAH